ncbi:CO2 hydration protein [Anthocerotibacter panamensis]|uniref:CO2 hydration protein n=1 Tax=Anthocerotibacter panamensis TaxID=2857077 RepID=UPI001C406170|nr:CO2 hydration protein [Anthocerotibacter panamensis]
MKTLTKQADRELLQHLVTRLETGGGLLPDTQENLLEVVGVLKSYGFVLDAYWRNLLYIADQQFLVLFPFFKYFNGEVTPARIFQHLSHNRINYEFAEYCLKAMFWHGGGGIDAYLDSPEFEARAAAAAAAKGNFLVGGLNQVFPGFVGEQVRTMVYYSALGQFWQVMSPMFLTLSDRYDRGEIRSVVDVVEHIRLGLVAAAAQPFVYRVQVKGQTYELVPESAGLTFLQDLAIPYVETVFFRSLPFMGTISYNAQAGQIPQDQGQFTYGALYADPLPIGGPGIPPTLLMQDMRRFLPDYLQEVYNCSLRQGDDLGVQICESFQKSMFCVTTAAILGLAPHPLQSANPEAQGVNRAYFTGWVRRLLDSRLVQVNA